MTNNRLKYRDWLVMAHTYATGCTGDDLYSLETWLDKYTPHPCSLDFYKDTPFEAVFARFVAAVLKPCADDDVISDPKLETSLRWHRIGYKLYKRWYAFNPN